MASSTSPLSSPSDSSYETVLAPTDAVELQKLGVVTAPKNGKRKISPTTTSSHTSEWTLPSPPASITSFESDIEIPETLHSPETFQFLGLTQSTAEMLWKRWIDIPLSERGPDGHISFLSMAEYLVNAEEGDCHTRTDDWEAFILKLGFDQKTADAIIDRGYDMIRYTESARYWLLDTLGLRWRALEEIQEESRLRLRMRQEKNKKRGGIYHTLNLRGGAEEPSVNPDHVPGSTILWHGSDLRWLQYVIDPVTGKYNFDGMQSTWPNDFRGIEGKGAVYYFSPQKAVGEVYANYAKRRSQSSAVRNVRMEVPNSILEKYKPIVVQHENSDMWKKVVWECRRRRRIPKPYSYLNSAELLIGPICHSKHSAIVNLESWEDISEAKHMLTVEEEWWNEDTEEYETKTRRGIQYVFTGAAIQEDLENKAKLEFHTC